MPRLKPSVAGQILSISVICILWVVALNLLSQAFPKYLPHEWPNAHAGDALVDWKAAKLFLLDVSPYRKAGLEYTSMAHVGMGKPPTTPFWFLLMSDYSLALAGELSSLLIWVLAPLAIYLTLRTLICPWPISLTVLIFAWVMSTSWFVYHFRAIQYSVPIAFLYVVGWWCLRRGYDLRAGLCLGAAATIKLFPGVMLVMLLVARRWRGFFAASAVYGLVAVVMTATYGIDSWPAFFEQQKPITRDWMGSLQNSSLCGLLTQLLHPGCLGEGPLDSRATRLASLLGMLLILSAFWVSRVHFRRALDTDARAIDVPYALVSLISVFANPWVWEHYYALCLHPMLIVAVASLRMLSRTYRRYCDRLDPAQPLLTQSILSVLVGGGLALVVTALNREIWVLWQYRDFFKRTNDSAAHLKFHVLQAQNFVPWLVLIALGFLLVLRSRRLGLTTRATVPDS